MKCRCCHTAIAAGHYCPPCRAELQALLDAWEADADRLVAETTEEVRIEVQAEYGSVK